LLLSILLLTAGLHGQQAACPVTQPPTPAFVPPPPFSAADRYLGFFLGSEHLWTIVWDHPVRGVPTDEGAQRVKWPGFATGLTPDEKTSPSIQITGKRIDDSAQVLTVEGPNYSMLPDGRYFFASALIFPSNGCWEITAKRKSFELKFVVQVVK